MKKWRINGPSPSIFRKIVENQTPRPIDFQENHWKINSPSPWIFKKLMENQYPCPLISIKTLENHWPHPIDFQAECGKSIPQPIDFHHESFEASYVLVGGWLAACLAGNQNLAELSFGRSMDFSPQEIPSSGFLATRNPEQKFLATRNPKQGISRHKKS